jgi:hypothetical protein
MTATTTDKDEPQADETIQSITCEDRGEGLNPRHVYLVGSAKCQCGQGPKLSERRME